MFNNRLTSLFTVMFMYSPSNETWGKEIANFKMKGAMLN